MNESAQPILNVDDYDPSRYARTKVLQQAGFHVLEAATGQEALRLITERSPSVVLLDVNLPDMSGFEVCRRIKSDPKTTAITVLHISASNILTQHQVHGLDSGADSYMVEPIDPSVLIATVKAFLRTRRAEEALRRSNDELEWFAYRVAHDLSEPLRTITAHVKLLERQIPGDLNDNTLQTIHFVADAAERMRSFIDEFLRYAHLTHADRVPVKFDCEAALQETQKSLAESMESSQAKLTHDPLPVVTADPALQYVFQNLISNAIKYRRPGVPPEIHIAAAFEDEKWLFSVKDNGIGIEPQYLRSIFHIFRRLHGRSIQGNGIGLALSQKIIEAHGGEIWAESDPGTGSTFFFTLPSHP
ncbi:MAG TPA: ATP-binding protein [Bryobacteraceae bacterium]|jgi:signal transduction histidine kinase